MKTTLVLLLALFVVGTACGTTVDGQVVEVTNNGSIYIVKIQLKVDVAAGLGGATLSLTFDNANLSYPSSPASGVDYMFHAYSGGNYTGASVSRPAEDRVTANIEYNGGGATLVNATYTDVVTITFTVLNPAGGSDLVWATTQALADDQKTAWSVGSFTGLNTDPLPIQLASFRATVKQEMGRRCSSWSTVSETNNYGFEVQKSADSTNVYETIENSFVAGNGTTIEPHSYGYTDVTATPGIWYYRLKQTDLDCAIHYSDGIRPTSLTGVDDRPLPTAFALDQNYPNPFNPTTEISFAVPHRERVVVQVFDVLGREIRTVADDWREAGTYRERFDAAGLSSGIYIFRMQAGEFTAARKMMVLR